MSANKPQWLNTGMSLWLHDAKFIVIKCNNPKNVTLEGENGIRSNHNIAQLFSSGHVKFTENNNDALYTSNFITSAEELNRANLIAIDLKSIANGNGRLKDIMDEVAIKYNVSSRTVARWKKAYLEKGIAGLIRQFDQRGGKGKKRLEEGTEELIQSGIKEHYLSNTPKSMDRTINLIRSHFAANGLIPPGVVTIRNRIKSLSENEILKAQKGSNFASDQLFVAQGEHKASRPLEKVQIDHSPIDMIILSKDGRQVIGRPHITIIQDVHTSLILGIYIGLEHPSFMSVANALREAVFTKEDILSKYNLNKDAWPSFGLMEMLHSDNAVEFDGYQMEHFCMVNLVEKQFRPIGKKEFGGLVENGIKAVMAYMHGLPGTTFSNTRERGRYDSEDKAHFDLYELRKLIYRWVINEFNGKPKDSLNGCSPIELWQKSIKDGWYPRMPADYDTFRFSLLPFKERQITRHGISISSLKYSGPCLRHWRALEKLRKKEKYRVHYDPLDMRWAYFVHPDGSGMTKLSLINLTSAHPISLEEIKSAKKKSSRYPRATPDLHLAHQQETELLNEASKKNKKARKLLELRLDSRLRSGESDSNEVSSFDSSLDYEGLPDYVLKDDDS